jgi:DNA-directed RNA polymerase alpha subunit
MKNERIKIEFNLESFEFLLELAITGAVSREDRLLNAIKELESENRKLQWELHNAKEIIEANQEQVNKEGLKKASVCDCGKPTKYNSPLCEACIKKDMRLVDLCRGGSKRLQNLLLAMQSDGIVTVNDILTSGDPLKTLAKIKNFGKSSRDEFLDILSKYDIHLTKS